eukprot:8139822-Pyramimonas_sp.AAC.1
MPTLSPFGLVPGVPSTFLVPPAGCAPRSTFNPTSMSWPSSTSSPQFTTTPSFFGTGVGATPTQGASPQTFIFGSTNGVAKTPQTDEVMDMQ